MAGLSDNERISMINLVVLIQNRSVTDRPTDRIVISISRVALSDECGRTSNTKGLNVKLKANDRMVRFHSTSTVGRK